MAALNKSPASCLQSRILKEASPPQLQTSSSLVLWQAIRFGQLLLPLSFQASRAIHPTLAWCKAGKQNTMHVCHLPVHLSEAAPKTVGQGGRSSSHFEYIFKGWTSSDIDDGLVGQAARPGPPRLTQVSPMSQLGFDHSLTSPEESSACFQPLARHSPQQVTM